MKFIRPVLCLVAFFGTGCAMLPSAAPLAVSDMPNCIESNYDARYDLFTLNAAAGDAVNQQCLLTVVLRGTDGPVMAFASGRYAVYFANGGGGKGDEYACDPGARGGHGYVALRLI